MSLRIIMISNYAWLIEALRKHVLNVLENNVRNITKCTICGITGTLTTINDHY